MVKVSARARAAHNLRTPSTRASIAMDGGVTDGPRLRQHIVTGLHNRWYPVDRRGNHLTTKVFRERRPALDPCVLLFNSERAQEEDIAFNTTRTEPQ